MTANSAVALRANQQPATLSSTPAQRCSAADFKVPAALSKALSLGSSYFDAGQALGRAKYEGTLALIPDLAERALVALAPIEKGPLVDRLTMLGLSMANGRDPAQITAWLHETARLLSDLPQSILCDAIDECVKEPGRVFAPSVGEIRAKAAGSLNERSREAAHLNEMARLIREGVSFPEWVPPPPKPCFGDIVKPEFRDEDRCTPEEAAAILAELGMPSAYADKLKGFLSPQPTRQEMIAQGKTPPRVETGDEDGWEMMP